MAFTRNRPHRQGVPAAMARYESLDDARRAIQKLEGHGVDGADVALAGWRARAAERSRRKEGADGRLVRHMTRSVVRGSVLGAVVGTLCGAVVAGIVIWAWSGEFNAW